MVAIRGTYQKGKIQLEEEYPSENSVDVIVTFLEQSPKVSEKKLELSDFSFLESQKILAGYKGSFSDAVIEERRDEL
jgi:hypothetical protein